MSSRSKLNHVFALLGSCVLLGVAPVAHAVIAIIVPPNTSVNGLPGFHLVGQTTGAPLSPEVLVTLNPQPLPPTPDPGKLSLDLTSPSGPVLSSNDRGNNFSLQWWMQVPAVQLQFPLNTIAASPPDANHTTHFIVSNPHGDPLFNVAFTIGPGPVDPASWVMLNPQPLPPKVGFQGFGVQFADPTAVEYSMTEFLATGVQVPLNFALVPEPSTCVLMGLGVLAVICARRRLA